MKSYSTVTELPSAKASDEQIRRLYQRYHFARGFCQGKDVLELACGAGLGLGYLAKSANSVVGADITEDTLRLAQSHCQSNKNVQVQKFDVQEIPFPAEQFDVVILLEAIYYLDNPSKLVEESFRVLKKNGVLLVGTVNKDWTNFHPSMHSRQYFSVPELSALLKNRFDRTDFYGGFPDNADGWKSQVTSFLKKIAVALHLIPKTMKGKEWLKRIFFGKLTTLPIEITEGMADYEEPKPIPSQTVDSTHKIIYAAAYKGPS